MPFNIGLPELMIVLIIALIVLGPKKLPSASRALGNGLREFKESLSGADPRQHDEDEDDKYALRP